MLARLAFSIGIFAFGYLLGRQVGRAESSWEERARMRKRREQLEPIEGEFFKEDPFDFEKSSTRH